MLVATLPTTTTGVILGLVPRTHGAARFHASAFAADVEQTHIATRHGWMGPRDKPEDDSLCMIEMFKLDRDGMNT